MMGSDQSNFVVVLVCTCYDNESSNAFMQRVESFGLNPNESSVRT